MSDGSDALLRAIYTALTTDSVVTGYVGSRVYDVPPNNLANTAFPFITMPDHSIRRWGADDFSGSEHTVELTVWTRPQAPSTKEAKDIMSAVRTVLDGADLTLSGQTLILLQFVDSFPYRDNDGQTFYGAITFRALTCT